MKTIGFIGAGRVTRILLGGFKAAGIEQPGVVASDPNAEALARLGGMFPGVGLVGADPQRAAAQDIVFLAVHPPVIPTVVPGMRAALKPDAILVSLAPKITLAKLRDLLGGFDRLARMIPNAPSIIGAGYNPVAFAPGLGVDDRQALRDLLAPLGECPEVAETKLEGYALLSGMGPTYLWFQLQTLRELAAQFGLDGGEVVPALKRTVCGSARTLLESGLSPTEVMDLVPVKPLAEDEATIRRAYQERLPALFAKIKP